MRHHIKRYILIFFGILCVVLGAIGAVLPLLPTTPFLILALACFSRSSPRFHQLLINNRWFGATLQQWEQSRTITRTAKRKAMILVVCTFAVSIAILHGRLHLQLFLLILGSILLLYMKRMKEHEADVHLSVCRDTEKNDV